MQDKQALVMDWISDNFDLDSVSLIPFDLFYCGVRVRDRLGSEILVYWDIWASEVKYCFPSDRAS